MKKIFTSLLVAAMIMMNGMTLSSALTYDESYKAAQSYYGKKTELDSADEVIAYESLGLQSDKLTMNDVVKTDYASNIAKSVIALTLHGNDPREYNGVNYVDMLEKCVRTNGAFDKENKTTFANFQVYGVYALYVIESPKATQAADYLASLIGADGSFSSSYGASVDLTAWCVEALSLVNKTKYQSTIDKAIAHIQASQDASAGYPDAYMGVNVNTQASVLMGLLAYDAAGVKGTKYNQGTNNPYDVLLTYQNANGSFWYDKTGEDNYFATLQGVQAVGYYYNGSVYMRAYQEYQELIKPVEKEEPKEEPKKETTDKKADIVETSDLSMVMIYVTIMFVSGFVVIRRGKIFE